MKESRSYNPRFPSMWEIKYAEPLGMTPDEYVKALRDAETYERQIAEERAERHRAANEDDDDE